ncbi:glycoside hydrolase family 95-like protein, partial [Verrucomicrobiota bacterium]
FRICAGLRPRGGTNAAEGDAIVIRDAEEVLIWINIGTSAKGGAPERESDRGLPEDCDWGAALAGHRAAFAEAYDGLELWCDIPASERPTDQRLAALRAGEPDPGLSVLFFNFGRYLLLTATACAELPPNLQGKWNEDLYPPWDCCYVYDVNLQMAYWPAEPTGLQRATGPLFRFLESHVPHAKKAAGDLFDCDGMWICMMTDAWARSTPESHGWAVWTGSGAWLAQHFWWHYEYGLDGTFLRERAYPFFKEIAAFYESFLIEDENGVLQSVPSQSPENHFEGGGDLPSTLCVSATVDLVLIRQVLGYAIESARILQVDADKRELWRSMLDRLPPFQVGRHGQLQEWLEDVIESEPGHRHFSHLLGLYPGDLMGPERTPELWEAGKCSVARRMAHEGGHSGWSRSWSACFYARFGDGRSAWEHAVHCLTAYATDSLLDLHPPMVFQIDGNFGFAAAVVEMLLQSYHGELHFLPALPPVWPSGSVRGMRARGGFTVDMTWQDRALAAATVTALRDGSCTILDMADTATVQDGKGNTVATTREGRTLRFETAAGCKYRIVPHCTTSSTR